MTITDAVAILLSSNVRGKRLEEVKDRMRRKAQKVVDEYVTEIEKKANENYAATKEIGL